MYTCMVQFADTDRVATIVDMWTGQGRCANHAYKMLIGSDPDSDMRACMVQSCCYWRSCILVRLVC